MVRTSCVFASMIITATGCCFYTVQAFVPTIHPNNAISTKGYSPYRSPQTTPSLIRKDVFGKMRNNAPSSPYRHHHNHVMQQVLPNDNINDSDLEEPTQEKDYNKDDNNDDVGRIFRGIINTGLNNTLQTGAIVIAKRDIPELSIYMDQSYELTSVYLQGIDPETGMVQKIPLEGLDDDTTKVGYDRYLTLYNPIYQGGGGRPVIVTPEEVGLVSLRDEVFDSVLFALPVLMFWLSVSFTFARIYGERTGGTFVDAFLGR